MGGAVFPPSHHCVDDATHTSHPLSPLLFLPSVIPSIGVCSSELDLYIKWSKYRSFSFSTSLLINIQGWFPLRLTGLISLLSKGLSRVFSSATIQKHQFFNVQHSLWSNSHIPTWLLEKSALIIWTFVGKVISLLFIMLSRFAIAFLPRNKHLLISWLWSPLFIIIILLYIFIHYNLLFQGCKSPDGQYQKQIMFSAAQDREALYSQ